VTTVVNEGVEHKGWKKRSDLYDEECQIKVEERNKVRIKMLNRRTRMNNENCKNKGREAKKMCKTKKQKQKEPIT
jgi:hypothetical protein